MSKLLGGIIGCEDKISPWHLNGFPDGSNIGSTETVYRKCAARRKPAAIETVLPCTRVIILIK